MLRLPGLNSLGLKLGLILLAVVTVALGVVYVAVIPRLESRIVEAKLSQLRKAAPALAFQLLTSPEFSLQDRVVLAAAEINARVIVFQRLSERELTPFVDSNQLDSRDVAGDSVALEALGGVELAEGRVERNGQEFAEVALPITATSSFILLLSAPLDDALRDVSLVRRTVLIAGAVALVVSWFAGSMAALRLARRIRRLEAAAERIASGDFQVVVEDEGRDEVGQLARAFERMRLRLIQLDVARREFIANASHELRTPLFALGGFLELLADEELDEGERREFVEAMREQVARLTRLATDLLDLSRLDAGQLELERTEVDLSGVASTLVAEFRALAEASGHELRLAGDGDALAVGDEQRILQIGRALLENAIRHTPSGTSIEVRTGARGERAELVVHDDGPGVPAEDQEHLFERFYRGNGGAAFGSGLGLAIARELALRMSGSIELVSRVGDTAFTLVLARARSAAPFSRENGAV